MGVAAGVVHWLREQGHDTVHLRDEGLQRLSDEQVFGKAISENRILLTFDLDFGEIAARSRGERVSVIILRLRNARTHRVIERLRIILPEAERSLEAKSVVVVEESRFRIRPFPMVPPLS